jgi:putative CocE/NonD family hydrolase
MNYIYERDVPMTTRDGVTLLADVWRPVEGRAPTLLMRTPYNKEFQMLPGGPTSQFPSLLGFVQAGYAVVWQDCRGTWASDGHFIPKVFDVEDGQDTVAWILDQEWSDGSIGTYGASYMGMTQWALATSDNPGLKVVAPTLAAADWYRGAWYSHGGALSLSVVMQWVATMYGAAEQRALERGETSDPAAMTRLYGALIDPLSLTQATPVADLPFHGKGGWADDWLAHPDFDDFWKAQDWSSMDSVSVPVLAYAGWYDLKVHAQVADFVRLRERGASDLAREGSRLIIGPWDHINLTGSYPDRYFGPLSRADLTLSHVEFYDHHLRNRPPATPAPRVRIFVMGIDQWRDEPDWPLPDTQYTDYHLTSGGAANTRDGDGVLSTDTTAPEGSDGFRYDPRDPVPTAGGAMLPSLPGFVGPVDQRVVDGRQDVLCYTGPVLTEAIEVTGPVKLQVYVSASTVDTDVTAKLIDVFPDGRAINLCDGILRLRYRNDLSRPEPMTPGEVYEVTVAMAVTSNVFLPGHRIRLDVSGSNFPRYDRNSNTGGVIASEALEDMVAVDTTVHHGGSRPSKLVLPVIDRP